MKTLQKEISNWIKNYANEYNIKSLIVGVSGGIDSAVTSTLSAMTGKKTIVVSMPINQKENELNRAHNHMKWLSENFDNVEVLEFDLTQLYETFRLMWIDEVNNLALANSRSRLRMTTLYQIATINKGLVVGTGNKVEDFGVGFYTKYGDGGVDISPIADLTKTQVRELAKELGVNQEIIDAPPTDGLWEDGRSDEDQIGATYEELEWAMEYDGGDITERQKEVLEIYKRFHTQNKHKMLPIPTFKL